MAQSSQVDILIVGAGPSGLMAANILSRYISNFGLKVRIIEEKVPRVVGQADGIVLRTQELFANLGLYQSIASESSPLAEIQFWNEVDGRLTRTKRIPDTLPGLSRFQQATLCQNRIEDILIGQTQQFAPSLIVERGTRPISMKFDSSSSHPIKVQLATSTHNFDPSVESSRAGLYSSAKSGLYRSNLTENSTGVKESLHDTLEEVEARFMIGSDGSRSWVRNQLGTKMIGDSSNYIWGVLDLVPITNFPGIRSRCAVHSANSGSVMVIPRERGLVRLYIQLESTILDGERFDRSNVTPESILSSAQNILSPYTIEAESIEWYTAYQIGQRLAETFSKDGVFLVGDAAHVHSPKAGQGMNVGIADSYNLATKLGLVCAGIVKPEILSTYSAEREVVAKHLIEFDIKYSKLFSGRPLVGDEVDGVDLKEFQNIIESGYLENAGFLINYAQSVLSNKIDSKQSLASHLPVGGRLFDAQVVSLASANAVFLLDALRFTGAYRLLVFAGNVAEQKLMNRVKNLATYLDSPQSIVSLYTPARVKRDSVIEIFTIHSSPREALELFDFPQPSIFNASNYNTIYVDGESYHKGDGKAYEKYGISKTQGALVVLRPDNYVAMICEIEDFTLLNSFFGAIFVEAKDKNFVTSARIIEPVNWKNESTHFADDSGIDLIETGLAGLI